MLNRTSSDYFTYILINNKDFISLYRCTLGANSPSPRSQILSLIPNGCVIHTAGDKQTSIMGCMSSYTHCDRVPLCVFRLTASGRGSVQEVVGTTRILTSTTRSIRLTWSGLDHCSSSSEDPGQINLTQCLIYCYAIRAMIPDFY